LVIKQINEEDLADVYLCEDATKVIKGESARVGKPIIPCTIGTSYYHGLCDIGSSISVIPYSLYLEIKPDIDHIVIEEAIDGFRVAITRGTTRRTQRFEHRGLYT
jgi:hypothetical protein